LHNYEQKKILRLNQKSQQSKQNRYNELVNLTPTKCGFRKKIIRTKIIAKERFQGLATLCEAKDQNVFCFGIELANRGWIGRDARAGRLRSHDRATACLSGVHQILRVLQCPALIGFEHIQRAQRLNAWKGDRRIA
jgi:hypothetical protein